MYRVRCIIGGLLLLVYVVGGVDAVVLEESAGDDNVCKSRQVGEYICPELFLLGVGKGGSTSLWVWIQRTYADEIMAADKMEGYRVKEVHFFDNDEWFTQGVNSYASKFPIRTNESDLAMEASPGYVSIVPVAERMYTSLPVKNLRFIVSFRDPLYRAYSLYKHAARDWISTNPAFEHGYGAFDYKFGLMQEYVLPILSECIESIPDPVAQYDICNRPESYASSEVIPSTGKQAIAFGVVLSLFSHGLYGPMMSHWFHYFEPGQFCISAFEKLTTDFANEVRHFEPCLRAFGLDLRNVEDEKLPLTNTAVGRDPGPFVQIIDRDEFAQIKQVWDEKIYAKSNELLRTLLWDLYQRDDFPRWEEREDTQVR